MFRRRTSDLHRSAIRLSLFDAILLAPVIALPLLFVVSLAPQTRTPIFASPTGKAVGRIMAAIGPVLPEEARGVLKPFWSGGLCEPVTITPASTPSV